jgi:hypothetical protein
MSGHSVGFHADRDHARQAMCTQSRRNRLWRIMHSVQEEKVSEKVRHSPLHSIRHLNLHVYKAQEKIKVQGQRLSGEDMYQQWELERRS